MDNAGIDAAYTEVWFSRLPEGAADAAGLPPAFTAGISEIKNEALVRQKLWARRTLAALIEAKSSLCAEDLRFARAENGKWISDRLEFSLSHTSNWVCAAVGSGPVGVDIEEFGRGFRPALTEKILSAEEKRVYGELDAGRFLQVWTRKESAFKQRGCGSFVPREVSALGENIRTFAVEDELYLSLCSDSAKSAVIRLWDGTQARETVKIKEILLSEPQGEGSSMHGRAQHTV